MKTSAAGLFGSGYARLGLLTFFVVQGVFCHSTGDLRLVNPDVYSSSGGRLEMYYGNSWAPFVIDKFHMHGADLACKKLGYLYASRYATVGTFGYDESYNDLSLSDLSCVAGETSSFDSCMYSVVVVESHAGDVGLQCTRSTNSLRLVSRDGYSVGGQTSGRLEILINSTWGTICDTDFHATQAYLACRELGFSSYNHYDNAANLNWYISDSNEQIWLDNLDWCTAESVSLRVCGIRIGMHDCTHTGDVILTCDPDRITEHYYYTTVNYDTEPYHFFGDLRLVTYGGSYGYSEGRLELYYSSQWLPFYYYDFNKHDADLACKQLGYTRAERYGTVTDLGYEPGSGSSLIGTFCPSDAYDFTSCGYTNSSSYSHYNDVAVSCTYESEGVSIGLIVGVSVGSLVLCTLLCLGGVLCAVILGMAYHKKKTRSSRSTVAQYQPLHTSSDTVGTFRISDQEVNTAHTSQMVPTAYYPTSQYAPVVLQHDQAHFQNGRHKQPNCESMATENEVQININDSNKSDDEEPLVI